jgi:hypothetical protein
MESIFDISDPKYISKNLCFFHILIRWNILMPGEHQKMPFDFLPEIIGFSK